MSLNRIQFVVVFILLVGSIFVVLSQERAHVITPVIPRVWVDAEMVGLQLPLSDSTASPKQVSSDYYYRIPARTIYKNYPVYAPGKEPDGYLESLKQLEPQSAFDPGVLKTEADWIRAGELVFDSPVSYDNIAQIADVRNPDWYKKLAIPATKDGTLPWFRYVIREKGKVELGTLSCGMCHTRVMPDGAVVKGAQGNLPFNGRALWLQIDSSSNRCLASSAPSLGRRGLSPILCMRSNKCLLKSLSKSMQQYHQE